MVNIAKTKERVYYKDVVVVEQAVNGTYSFTPEKDVLCEITLVGAGSGGAFNSSSNRSSAAAGGSGSGCILLAVLKAGQTYNAIVGEGGIVNGGLDMNVVGGPGGDTWVKVGGEEILVAPGGIGGHVWWPNSAEAGAPAPLPTVATENPNIEFKKWIFSKQGIPGAIMGNPSAGGASVIDGTTYGQGGRAWNAGGSSRGEVGKDGYIKVVYKEPVKGPENLDVLTYTGRNVYMAAGESINIPDGKNGNVNKFLTVTTQESSAFLNSDDDDFYLWIDASGKLFLRATKYFYFQEEEPTEARQLKYWYKPSEHIWRLTEDNGATWQIYEMGVIGRAWQDYSTGDVSDVHYEPYGEWDNYEDVTKSYVAKRKIRTYRKKFIIPVLTENGVMGGETFAVDCSTPKDNVYEIFNAGADGTKAVDTNPNAAPQWVRFYNPIPLKVTKLRLGQIKNTAEQNNYYITAWKVQASDDKETWFDVWSGTATKPAQTLVADIEDSGYHKYYRAYVVSAQYYSGYPRVFFCGIDFDAEAEDAVFYDEKIESYAAKRKIRRYYKYEYEDWEQPNFTGYTTDGAIVSATSEDTADGRLAWKALQTSAQPAANTSDNYGKNNTSTAVWKVKFPYLLKISKIEHQARNWNNSIDYNTVGAYYADEDKTKKIGDINSPSSGAWTAFNVDYLTDTILLDITGGGSWAGIGRLKITAQKATPVEVSASDDWDYYVDTDL